MSDKVVDVSTIEVAAGVSEQSTYGKYFDANFGSSGGPSSTKDSLEKYIEDPQQYSDEIISMARYYYRKDGLIMRTVNIIRDFGATELKLEYEKGRTKVKNIIDAYNEKIDINRLIKDILFELAITGNCALYDRDGEWVDIYPLKFIEVSPLIVNGKPQLLFDNSHMDMSMGDEEEERLKRELEAAYPEEVRKGLKKGQEKIPLDYEKTYFLKTNCSRYEKYGVTFLLPAFSELEQKNLLKQAEKSTASGVIDQILHIKVGDKDNKPTQPVIEEYHKMFTGKKGAIRVTTPYYVKAEWVVPEVEIFGEEKYTEIDKDLLASLGVSLTLLRGEGGGNYSEGMINIAGLIKTIESVREGIPRVIRSLYQQELLRCGINADKAPKVSFGDIVIDKATRVSLVQWLFQNAGLPYEVLFEEHGYDYDSIKLVRKEENHTSDEDVFTLRSQPFQGGVNQEGGRPEKPLHERKSDKSASNNDQPRPGVKQIERGD